MSEAQLEGFHGRARELGEGAGLEAGEAGGVMEETILRFLRRGERVEEVVEEEKELEVEFVIKKEGEEEEEENTNREVIVVPCKNSLL